jgi:hypothetical protein
MNLADLDIPLIFWISFILIVWFESDIMTTIATLTNTRNLIRIDEFSKYKLEVDAMSNYPTFLYSKYPSYFTKLISCPICLCFWSTLATVSVLVYTVGYHEIYTLLLFPINYVSSLFIYLIIRKLL